MIDFMVGSFAMRATVTSPDEDVDRKWPQANAASSEAQAKKNGLKGWKFHRPRRRRTNSCINAVGDVT